MRSLGLGLRFLALVAAIVVAICAVGYAPTERLGGGEAIWAMLAGCLASAVASVLGALPLVLGRPHRSSGVVPNSVSLVLVSMGLRFGVALALGGGLAVSGWLAPVPLLLWLAISYLALLGAEVWYSTRVLRGERPVEG